MTIRLGIVVPCYNEEDVLPETHRRLAELLMRLQKAGLVSSDSAVYFVDDGSRDQTWHLIEGLAAADPHVVGVKLSRNSGHQKAVLAGLLTAKGDAVVSIDADLQDDVDVIEEMVRRFHEGSEIVYGVRKSRSSDTVFKRGTAQAYYGLLRSMGVEAVYNHADFRLLGRRAIDSLAQYSEVNLFLRAIVPLLGFPSATVYYDRSERFAGVSKYPLRRMLGLAIDGITSFSVTPLRFISVLGMLVCLLSIGMIAWVAYGALVMNTTVPGWASSVIPIYFLGGVQLLSVGVLGEYVAKIYLETKRRPRYFIETLTGAAPEQLRGDQLPLPAQEPREQMLRHPLT
jgi:polyisoprenyl-phosphate glycosyltransferase